MARPWAGEEGLPQKLSIRLRVWLGRGVVQGPTGSDASRKAPVSKFVNAVVLGLVSFILILAVFWYVVEIRQESQVAITDVGVGWGAVNNRTTEVKVRLTVYNPHKSPVLLQNVDYQVIVNGNQLVEASTNETVRIEPESEGTKEFTAIVFSRFVVDWMDSHLENDERTRMQVKGEAEFAISTLRTVASFDWESSWEGLYVHGFAKALHNCPQANASLCIDSTRAEWDTTGTQSVLQTIYQLRNMGGNDLKVKSWSVDLELHGVVVARGGTPATFTLPANGNVDIEAPIVFERLQLPQWWPAHVRDCERSTSHVVIRYVIEEQQPVGPDGSVQTVLTSIVWTFDAPAFDTRFICTPR
jgi:LEA14-like dessication related protein